MKEDEIKFFKTMVRLSNVIYPRDIINIIKDFIHYKRCWYLLNKWSGLGFYNYGVTLDLGWIEFDKLPDRYKELLED